MEFYVTFLKKFALLKRETRWGTKSGKKGDSEIGCERRRKQNGKEPSKIWDFHGKPRAKLQCSHNGHQGKCEYNENEMYGEKRDIIVETRRFLHTH
ncbi:hypothetical protein [uncultured Dubosiella sp.]|uniref:hypothetical protein n=1 Tax=uncultured Dubosiella sp. TaxID=1937011 RepID=UPI0027312410|nr:hypothetical protein [uncultured Dubosiella sp.]